MVYCSINSRKKVYHTADCWYTKRTKEKNRITFNTTSNAEIAGYEPCSCCCAIGRQFRKERREIKSFCTQNNYQHFIKNGEFFVVSFEDTAWRIVPKGKDPVLFILYHESLGGVNYKRSVTPYFDREFHQQKVFKNDILSYLGYIKSHDEYRERILKQRRAEREKFKDEVMQIHGVRKTIARQNRKRGKVKSMKGTGQNRHIANQQLKMLAQATSSYQSARAAYI